MQACKDKITCCLYITHFFFVFSTGSVITVESLNDVAVQEFTVIVYARYGQASNYVMLSVSLYDEVSNFPKFLQSEYSACVKSKYAFYCFSIWKLLFLKKHQLQ